MKSSTLISWLLLISGTSIYVIGLGMAWPLLSGKGYFLGVLVTAMFVTYVYLREEKRDQLDALITLGLFLVGILNAPLSLSGRGLYPVALFMGLLGFVRLIRAWDQ